MLISCKCYGFTSFILEQKNCHNLKKVILQHFLEKKSMPFPYHFFSKAKYSKANSQSRKKQKKSRMEHVAWKCISLFWISVLINSMSHFKMFCEKYPSVPMIYVFLFNLLSTSGSMLQATEIKDSGAICSFGIHLGIVFIQTTKIWKRFLAAISPVSGMSRWLLCTSIWGVQSLPH